MEKANLEESVEVHCEKRMNNVKRLDGNKEWQNMKRAKSNSIEDREK